MGNVVPFDDAPFPGDEDAPLASAGGKRRKGKAIPDGDRTELQLADQLVERFGEDLRYCAELGGWHAWAGTHWTLDRTERAREMVKTIARELAQEAAADLDQDTFRAAKRAGSARGVSAVLDLARSTPGIVFPTDDADRDPWLLATLSGTLALRTRELRPNARADLLTRCAGASYDPEAKAPTFERFLEEVQPDPEVRAYLARLMGYAATGLVREHVLGVLWGPGANGKSVFAECIMHALGDYARPGPSSLIVGGGGHEPHPTDVASCVGSRLVVVHETKRGATFDASKVKHLTGGDRLTARHMRQDFFAFAPSHTLVMLSNYKPQADASDAALWRRVQLVPFEVVVPEERRDTTLGERIRETEAAGVLRWIVDGCLEWQRMGLAPPAVVREQTEAYRASEDVIGAFLEERCERSAGARVQSGVLYGAYRKWCEAQGIKPARSNDFVAELEGRGFRRERTMHGRYVVGLELLELRNEGSEWWDR